MISVAELVGEGQAKSGGNGVPFAYANPYESNGLPEVTYYLHDHLGNTRVTYTAGCKTEGEPSVPIRELTLVHAADYHPYGSILREWRDGPAEKYLTTHHERDTETGLDYRGARYYDADVARFLSLDPLAADYASWSTYNYVMGNPVSMVDPDGRSPYCGCPDPPCPSATEQKESTTTPSERKTSESIEPARKMFSINQTASTKATFDFFFFEIEKSQFSTQNAVQNAPFNLNLENGAYKSATAEMHAGELSLAVSPLSWSVSRTHNGTSESFGIDNMDGIHFSTSQSIEGAALPLTVGESTTIRPTDWVVNAALMIAGVPRGYINASRTFLNGLARTLPRLVTR